MKHVIYLVKKIYNMNSKETRTTNEWRDKAVERNATIKELKKRIKEKDTSRELWKAKANKSKKETLQVKAEIASIKKKLKKIVY